MVFLHLQLFFIEFSECHVTIRRRLFGERMVGFVGFE